MPKVSKVHTLPAEAKAWLDKELIKRGFSGYEELEEILAEKEIYIGKSSLHRYGTELKNQQMAIKESTEAAKAIVEVTGDDEGAMGQALTAMVQKVMFDLLIASDAEELSTKALSQIATAISRINRANIAQKKYAQEVKQRAKVAADKAAKIASQGGLSAESVELIKEQILGVPDG